MSVYVDNGRYPYGRMVMCHMAADTLEELHEMADKIGIKRRWFQNKSNHPHYDICLAKRAEAVKLGAQEVSTIFLVRLLNRQYATSQQKGGEE